ncbi:MAG: lipid II flippase MurJ [Patescibacteria group bacterium]
MVRRVLDIFYSEVRGLHQAAYVLALFAFGSQMLALIRDRSLASTFGTGIELDLYYSAFRIPDLLFVLFASVLSVYVLIPFVSRTTETAGEQAGAQLLSQIFSLFLVTYVAIAAVLFVLAPAAVGILFPGLSEHTTELATLMRILLLQPLLLGISSLFGVITQLHHRFVVYAISPLFYNIGIIIGVVVFYPLMGLSGLVWGVVLGSAAHMLVQLPLVRSTNLRFGFTTTISRSFLREVCAVAIPRALTLSLNQIVLLVLVSVASVMAVGSVSVFQFAFNLQSVPLAIVGVSYSVAAFPALAEMLAKQRMREFSMHIITALRHIIFWSLPIIVLMIVLRAHIVRVLLGSGEFDWDATRLTAAVLALFVISLAAQAVNLLIIRAFYAAGKTKVPLLITLFSSVGAIFFAGWLYVNARLSDGFLAFFEEIMRVSGVPGTEVLMLPLGYSIGMIIQSILLLLFARRAFSLPLRWLLPHVARAGFAAAVGGFMAYVALNFVVDGINPDTFVGISIQGLIGGIAGVAGTVLAYYVVRSPELFEVATSLEGKIFKTDVVAPQEEVL